MKSFSYAAAAALFAAACASKSEDVSATYVSPIIYNSYECDALLAERERIRAEVVSVSRAQDDKAANDAVATGVGVVIFFPALFFLASGSDRESELASLKGNYEAVQQNIIQRQCLTPAQLEAEKAAEEQARLQLEAERKARAATDEFRE